MSVPRIPFNRASFVGTEQSYVADAVRGAHISGDGPYTERCEQWLETQVGVSRALLTPSCTHALELAAILSGIGPGDEVVLPSFTFVSTANAFALRGATPVFADIRPDTLNLDPESVAAVSGPRTRVIVPVHYGGVGCDMEALASVGERWSAQIIEDNAHGLMGAWRGQPLGTFGPMATLSFHETKNFTCGEGGALLINDPAWVDRAEIVRQKGTNRAQFVRGQVDKYTWVDLGSSHVMSDLLAAVLWSQFEVADRIQAKRRAIWDRYYIELKAWADATGSLLPTVPDDTQQAYHLFYLVLPTTEDRNALISHLGQRDILAVFHYVPLHSSPMGKRFGGRVGQCPVAEDVSARLVRLPFFNDLSYDDQSQVIEGVLAFGHG